jgi:DNA polymerase III gamma/tau subunit
VTQHVAGAGHPSHSARHVAAASNGKAAQGQVKTVAGKAAVANPNATKAKPKAALVVQGKKPHAQFAQTRASQGKVVHANFVQGRGARPQTVKVAAKSTVAKPAAPHATTTAASANVGAMPPGAVAAHPARSNTNPATASSGSLPPILH